MWEIQGGDHLLDASILELAKTDVRAAMKKEIELNERIIEEYKNLNRYSKRELKCITLEAIVRNDTLKWFLSLDQREQKPILLKEDHTANGIFTRYVRQTYASNYANIVKAGALTALYLNYTHGFFGDKRRNFLDEPHPEPITIKTKPRPSAFISLIGKLASMILQLIGMLIVFIIENFWRVFTFAIISFYIVLAIFSIFSDPDDTPTVSTNHTNTFNTGGIAGGNSSSKSVSDDPQVMDQSGQTGFGNGGESGHDSASSGTESVHISSENSKTLTNGHGQVDEVSLDNSDIHIKSGIAAEYYLPNSGCNGLFNISEGQSVVVNEGEEIVLQLELVNGNLTTSYWNGELLKGQQVLWNEGEGTVTFWSKAGMNEIKVVYLNDVYNFYFDTTGYISLGSSKQHVIEVIGEKGKSTESSYGDDVWWIYGDKSYIHFNSDGQVVGWRNVNNFLKVLLGNKEDKAPEFMVGSSEEAVIKAMGTPTEIDNDQNWIYGSSIVYFSINGTVSAYSNKDGSLKVDKR